ncbi:hypothetical protein [Actomonas aquatica]|uniref:Lipase modulator n=1 Tax=Actomonas aquatica TaxID=2866162 RepID=A0ABZ1CAB3_9BACT|nr:hypothetical protein [Opitutus sp. WL0086]WRQ88237.1 hypothetical protein K1X11_002385 [Opitutus sp. WL0086]
MLRFAVFASLIANAALGFLWWTTTPQPDRSPPLPPASIAADRDDAASATNAREAPPPPSLAALLADPALNDTALIERLRHCQLPAALISQIIRQRVHARFAADWQALVEKAAAQPYWNGSGNRIPDPLRQAMRDLDRRENQALIDLLGPDALEGEPGQLSTAEYDYLPASKRLVLTQLLDDYADLRNKTWREARAVALPEDQAILQMLRQEEDAEIQALLSPAEYTEYLRRHSPAALEVQNSLRGFAATEVEYLQLLELHAQFVQKFGAAPDSPPIGPTGARDRAQRQHAWQDVLNSFGASLEGERAEEWALQTDGRYQMTERFGLQQQLDAGTIRALYRFERDFQTQADALNAYPANSTDAQYLMARQALIQFADQKLQALLPAATRDAYQRTFIGLQIRGLKERASRP